MTARKNFSLYHEIPANTKAENLQDGERPTHTKVYVYFNSRGYYSLWFANVHRKVECGMMCESQDLETSGKNAINLGSAPRFSAKKLAKIELNLLDKIDSIGMMWLDAGLNETLKVLVKAWANQ